MDRKALIQKLEAELRQAHQDSLAYHSKIECIKFYAK